MKKIIWNFGEDGLKLFSYNSHGLVVVYHEMSQFFPFDSDWRSLNLESAHP